MCLVNAIVDIRGNTILYIRSCQPFRECTHLTTTGACKEPGCCAQTPDRCHCHPGNRALMSLIFYLLIQNPNWTKHHIPSVMWHIQPQWSNWRSLLSDVITRLFSHRMTPLAMATKSEFKWAITQLVQCESKKSHSLWFSDFFPKRLGILNNFLHTYYAFLSTLDYKFLFNYLQLWRSYAIY